MGLKLIFQEGMKERKRRKALNKVTSELKDKEKIHAGQLVALGQKAWESRSDISAYADLKTALGDTQKTLDESRAQAELLQKQKQESEAIKKQENERLGVAQKDIEGKKRQEDSQLSEKKNALLGDQKESQHAMSRLAAIARERSQLQNKGANPAVTDAEKKEIAGGIDLLAREEEELKAANQAREAAGRPLAAAIAALQEESARLQKLIDELRQEQKKVNGELDKQISALAGDLARSNDKTSATASRQKLQFRDLGEKLAAAQNVAPDIAREMAAVLNARTEMQGVQSLIGGLERQKDEAQASAYKKMRAILIVAVILVAALVAALILLLAPKRKPTPFEAMLEDRGEVAQRFGEIAGQLEKKLGDAGQRGKGRQHGARQRQRDRGRDPGCLRPVRGRGRRSGQGQARGRRAAATPGKALCRLRGQNGRAQHPLPGPQGPGHFRFPPRQRLPERKPAQARVRQGHGAEPGDRLLQL